MFYSPTLLNPQLARVEVRLLEGASASEWRRETTLKIWLALPRPAEKETVTLLAIYLGFPVGNRLPNEGLCRWAQLVASLTAGTQRR